MTTCTYCGKKVEEGTTCICGQYASIKPMSVQKAIALIEEHRNFMADQCYVVPARFLDHILAHLKAIPHDSHPKPRQTSPKKKPKPKKKRTRTPDKGPITIRNSIKSRA